MGKSVEATLRNELLLAEAEIATSFNNAIVASTRRSLVDEAQLVNADGNSVAALAELGRIAGPFIPSGLTGIALLDKQGKKLAVQGMFTPKPALAVPLKLPGQVQILWGSQLFLRSTVELKATGLVVGKVVTEWALPGIGTALQDASRLGKTAEMALCAPLGVQMQCFPTALNPKVLVFPRVTAI